PRGIFQTRQYMFASQTRIGLQHFLDQITCSEKLQYGLYGDPGAFKDRFAVTNIRSNFDQVLVHGTKLLDRSSFFYGNFGNFWKSGSRFSRNALRPSCASSMRYYMSVASPANSMRPR